MSVRGAYPAAGGSATTVAAAAPTRLRVAVAGSMAGKAVEMATLVLLATVVPRVLGPRDYGRFAVPLTIVTVGSLALTLGGPALMARFVPAADLDDRVALARALGARLARGRAAQLTAIGVVAAGAAVWLPQHFPPLTTALVIVALALNVATSLTLQVGLGLGRTGPWSARFPLQNTVLIAAVLILHPLAGPTGAVAALLVAAVVATAFAAVSVAPALTGDHPRVGVPTVAIRFGALHAAGAALVQLTQRGGIIAVALLAGSAVQTGYASLAIGIALGATYAVLQAFTVCLPHLAARTDLDSDTPGEAEVTLRRLAGGLLVLLLPTVALTVLVLDSLVPAVFGADYEGATAAFAPALALMVLAPLHSLTVQSAALRTRPEATLAGGVAAAAAFVVVAVAAVPAWGATGGTAAALAGGSACAVVSLRLLPGAAGRAVPLASFAGAAAVLALAALP